ncbi:MULTISPECIES: hypothetical protein [Saccharibacillus]|nr:hypothetical protein [Saccharibacillus sp. WB 17]MWJ32155.1 hypothetical protein [Saccharibacillus sp. WB 17]
MDNERVLFDMVAWDGHEAITRIRGSKDEGLCIDFKDKADKNKEELDESE